MFGVVILAAGVAERFGSPKQVALFRGRPLLGWVCEAALLSGASQVVLVVHSHFERLGLELPTSVEIVENAESALGMSSSIRVGIQALRAEIEVAIVALGDQPLVPAEHFAKLAETQNISASLYDEIVVGAPAGFAKTHFPELEKLTGDQGAKIVLMRHRAEVEKIPLIEWVDIDTPEDLAAAEAPIDLR